jgi:hypothetical protein
MKSRVRAFVDSNEGFFADADGFSIEVSEEVPSVDGDR